MNLTLEIFVLVQRVRSWEDKQKKTFMGLEIGSHFFSRAFATYPRFCTMTMNLTGNEAIRAFMDEITSTTSVAKYVELPMIAVMGDTSSGKSSLLTSISMVELPSNSALTTRCPILLQMKKAENREATVSVSWHDTPSGKPGEDIDFSPRLIKSKKWATLPDAIADAQSHIIKITGKEVARDKVHVKVSGPHCEDLTLIDLPGIVRSRGDGEGTTIVEDISALMHDFLGNKRCVILAVVPANVDFHNSQIMADAQKVDPETKRTIPVITKPDLIDKGGEDDVKRLLFGEKMKFLHGFHMVKGRSQADLDMQTGIDRAMTTEESFFNNTEPWRSVARRDLFGTQSLRKKLGSLQMKMFREEIPAILSEITAKMSLAQAALVDMGQPLSSRREKSMFFKALSQKIISTLTLVLKGEFSNHDGESIAAKIHDASSVCKEKIVTGRLVQIATVSKGSDVLCTTKNGVIRGKIVEMSDDMAFIDYADRATVRRDDFIADWKIDTGACRVHGTVFRRGDKVAIANHETFADVLKGFPLRQIERDPRWLSSTLRKRRNDSLPIFLNNQAFQSLVREFIMEDWKPCCIDLAEKVCDIVCEAFLLTFDSALGSDVRYLRLRERLILLQVDLEGLIREQSRKLVEDFVDGQTFPFSQNDYLFETFSKKRNERTKKQLVVALGLQNNLNTDVSKSSVAEIVEAVFDRNQRRSMDEFIVEDMVQALESYGKVAMKRFIDEVPTILWKRIRAVPGDFEKMLWDVSDEEVEHYLEASPDLQRRYEETSEELEQLTVAHRVFKNKI